MTSFFVIPIALTGGAVFMTGRDRLTAMLTALWYRGVDIWREKEIE